uniref:Enoyl reductase (ER) domain-containing protein n=1 Tax=Meleagris gallopavo TaxID=9103 RepID=A0A803YMU0_MELGA
MTPYTSSPFPVPPIPHLSPSTSARSKSHYSHLNCSPFPLQPHCFPSLFLIHPTPFPIPFIHPFPHSSLHIPITLVLITFCPPYPPSSSSEELALPFTVPLHLPSRLFTLRLPARHGARGYRAALCTQLAQPLLVQDLPAPRLQPCQVRVRVHYCGLNFADILACQGLYQEKRTPPFTPGMEFSGTVMETGENVSAVKEGHRVIGVSGVSAMAEECIVNEKALWQIPDNMSSEDAAVLPVAYGTAWLALHHRAHLQPQETVLVTAGAGATGLAIIDLAVSVFQAKFGLGGQDCGDGFCRRENPLNSCQPAAPQERVSHGSVLGSIPAGGLPPFLLCHVLPSSVLPGGKDPSTDRSGLQTGRGE